MSDEQTGSLEAQMASVSNSESNTLVWRDKGLTLVPADLYALGSTLTHLDLSMNDIKFFNLAADQLTALTFLSLADNELAAVPPTFGQLHQLVHLELADNSITSLGDEIGQLTALRVLDLGGNRLSALPDSISRLHDLRILKVGFNNLSKLSGWIGSLTNLEELHLVQNRLTSLPPEVGSLLHLRELHLSKNKLLKLPIELGKLTNLKVLSVDNNDLVDPPQILTRLGPEAVLLYLRSVADESISSFDEYLEKHPHLHAALNATNSPRRSTPVNAATASIHPAPHSARSGSNPPPVAGKKAPPPPGTKKAFDNKLGRSASVAYGPGSIPSRQQPPAQPSPGKRPLMRAPSGVESKLDTAVNPIGSFAPLPSASVSAESALPEDAAPLTKGPRESLSRALSKLLINNASLGRPKSEISARPPIPFLATDHPAASPVDSPPPSTPQTANASMENLVPQGSPSDSISAKGSRKSMTFVQAHRVFSDAEKQQQQQNRQTVRPGSPAARGLPRSLSGNSESPVLDTSQKRKSLGLSPSNEQALRTLSPIAVAEAPEPVEEPNVDINSHISEVGTVIAPNNESAVTEIPSTSASSTSLLLPESSTAEPPAVESGETVCLLPSPHLIEPPALVSVHRTESGKIDSPDASKLELADQQPSIKAADVGTVAAEPKTSSDAVIMEPTSSVDSENISSADIDLVAEPATTNEPPSDLVSRPADALPADGQEVGPKKAGKTKKSRRKQSTSSAESSELREPAIKTDSEHVEEKPKKKKSTKGVREKLLHRSSSQASDLSGSAYSRPCDEEVAELGEAEGKDDWIVDSTKAQVTPLVKISDQHIQSYYCEAGQKLNFFDAFTPKQISLIEGDSFDDYSRYFYQQEHFNFITEVKSTGELMVISVLKQPESQGHRVFIRSNEGDKRATLPASQPPMMVAKDFRASLQKWHLVENVLPAGLSITPVMDPTFQKQLLAFERKLVKTAIKVGVVYRKKGQKTEDDILGNDEGSEEFYNFMNCIADKIKLQGWDKYDGGLDTKDNKTGTHAYHANYQGVEVMFHVSTLLPSAGNDPEEIQEKKKAHIGNDYVVIVFVEGDEPFSPHILRSKFNQVFIVVRKVNSVRKKTVYQLTVAYRTGVEAKQPALPADSLFERTPELRSFMLAKIVNSERTAIMSALASQLKSIRTQLLLFLFNKYKNTGGCCSGKKPAGDDDLLLFD